MFTSKFSHCGLPLALAALLAIALPGVRSASAAAAASNEATTLIKQELPKGTTLAAATCKATSNAVHSATLQRTDLAAALVGAGIVAKTPKQGQGELDCKCVMQLVAAGASAAPQSVREIVEMALSLAPQCQKELEDFLNQSNNEEPGFIPNQGLGIGFPGSPGFTGSAPGGTIALPPNGTAVTPFTNG